VIVGKVAAGPFRVPPVAKDSRRILRHGDNSCGAGDSRMLPMKIALQYREQVKERGGSDLEGPMEFLSKVSPTLKSPR
jgi:hypothetical protein